MRSLVTGGAGFIGSHVADELLQMGHEVVVVDDLSGGSKDNVSGAAMFVRGSIMDEFLIGSLFEDYKFDYVYHCAAYAAEGLSHFIKRFNHTNNLIGSVNLINASVNHGVKCFVFTSSIAVYGSGQTPFREDDTPHPEDSYGIAKLAVEMELKATHRMFGLPYVIFRPHNVYGERQNIGDRYRNVVGIFMNQCLKGEPMTIFGDGMQERAFTHVGDIANTIAKAPIMDRAKCNLFNIGADQPTTVYELSSMVADVMGVPHKVVHLPERQEARIALSDHDRLDQVFGIRYDRSLEDGLEDMAAWVKQHGARESSVFTGIEIEKNLPPSWAAVIKKA